MKKTRFLTTAAVIAAAYAALTLVLMPYGYGPVQLRVAEVLTVLPFFSAAAIPGLTVGCIISNMFGGYGVIDVVFGSTATLLAAFSTYLLRKIPRGKYLAPLPPVIFNALIVSAVIAYGSNPSAFNTKAFYAAYAANAFSLAVSELIVCYVLGLPLLIGLEKYKDKIFK